MNKYTQRQRDRTVGYGKVSDEYAIMKRRKDMEVCQYTKKFPVDQWGHIGGLFSVSNVPIVGHKEFTREGIILSRECLDDNHFEIEDAEKGWVFSIPKENISTGKSTGLSQ